MPPANSKHIEAYTGASAPPDQQNPVRSMNDSRAYCSRCGWIGDDFHAYGPDDLALMIPCLSAGDVIPSGVCPDCAGLVYPTAIRHEPLVSVEMAEGEEDASPAQWDVHISRGRTNYTLHVMHPDGFGSEIILDIVGERPNLQISTWNDAEEFCEAEPVGYIKIGKDHLLLTNNAHLYPTSVIATAEDIRPKLMTYQQWDGCKEWDAVPE